jgi:hypothetical protein
MTTFDFYKKFDTDKKCADFLESIRWEDGAKCPYCGHSKYYVTNPVARRGNKGIKREFFRRELKCANSKCWKKFNVTSGTIFQCSKSPLWKFFFLIFSCVQNKKNVSSHQQAENLGMTQETCWSTMARIRLLCYQDADIKLSGDVEIDETYMRMAKWKRPKYSIKEPSRKFPILGLLQRGGKIVLKSIPNKEKRVVQKIIFKHVEVESRLLTDSAPCYNGLSSYYRHEFVNHREGEYVRGDVYTNGIEMIWGHLKKALTGTHHGVSELHIQSYLDEFAYRFNNRHLTPEEKFIHLMKRACNVVIKRQVVRLGVKANIQRRRNAEEMYNVVDTETGRIYKSATHAAAEFGIDKSNLAKMLKGTRPNKTTLKRVEA